MTSETDDSTGYRRYLARRYLASLPERTARAGAALTGGLVYETGEVLLPLAVRRSRFYQAVVGFDYYRGALRTIADEGLVSYLYRTSTPYLTRARSHFDPGSSTLSERLLRRWADRRSSAPGRTTQDAESSAENDAEDHQ